MRGQTNHFILDNHLQRELRKSSTDAERALWRHLCARQLGGYKFRRQHPFDGYVLDFVCIECKLVIEVDGGQHDESMRDKARDEFLARAGFQTLRFWNNEVLQQTEAVLEVILRRLENHPHPGPLLEGEGAEHV